VVYRGSLDERASEEDDNDDNSGRRVLTHSIGDIVGLQNILPSFEGKSVSNISVSQFTKARIFKIDITNLRE